MALINLFQVKSKNRYHYYDLYLLPLNKNKAKFAAVPDTKSAVLWIPSSQHSRGTSWNRTPRKLDCGQLTWKYIRSIVVILGVQLAPFYTSVFRHNSLDCDLQFSDDPAIIGLITVEDNRGLIQVFVDWCQQNHHKINAGKRICWIFAGVLPTLHYHEHLGKGHWDVDLQVPGCSPKQ